MSDYVKRHKPSFSRTREDGGFSPQVVTEWKLNTTCSNVTWEHNATLSPGWSGEFRSMTDIVVPGFLARQQAGELFNNPMRSDVTSCQTSEGTGYLISGPTITCSGASRLTQYKSTGPLHDLMFPRISGAGAPKHPILMFAATDAQVRDVATQVSTSIAAKRGSGSAWESAAELDKTLAMFSKPIQKYAKLCNAASRAIRKGEFGKDLVKALPAAWMTYRYGLMPIVYDIQGITDNLKEELGKQRGTTRAHVQLTERKVVTGSTQFGVTLNGWSNTIVDVITVRGWSLDEFERDALNQFGFTTKGLLTLPWELTTASFAVDWIANIGDFLGSQIPALGWNCLMDGYVITRATSNVYSHDSMVSTNPTYKVIIPASGTTGLIHLAKQRYTALPPVGLVMKADFKMSNFKRAADAVSLLSLMTSKTFGAYRKNLRI